MTWPLLLVTIAASAYALGFALLFLRRQVRAKTRSERDGAQAGPQGAGARPGRDTIRLRQAERARSRLAGLMDGPDPGPDDPNSLPDQQVIPLRQRFARLRPK